MEIFSLIFSFSCNSSHSDVIGRSIGSSRSNGAISSSEWIYPDNQISHLRVIVVVLVVVAAVVVIIVVAVVWKRKWNRVC